MPVFLHYCCKRIFIAFILSINIFLFFFSIHVPDALSTLPKECIIKFKPLTEISSLKVNSLENLDNLENLVNNDRTKSIKRIKCIKNAYHENLENHDYQLKNKNFLYINSLSNNFVNNLNEIRNKEQIFKIKRDERNIKEQNYLATKPKMNTHMNINMEMNRIYSDNTLFETKVIWNNIEIKLCQCSANEIKSMLINDYFTTMNQTVIPSSLQVGCHVNIARREIFSKKGYITFLVSLGITIFIGFVTQGIVTFAIFFLWWLFFWNNNAFKPTLRRLFKGEYQHAIRIIPEWIERDRKWGYRVRNANLILKIFYSWIWFIFEGIGTFKPSIYDEYRIIYDESNPLILVPEYKGYLNALAYTTRHVREEIYAYERLDTKRLVTSKVILPIIYGIILVLLMSFMFIVSLAFRLNNFFVFTLYLAESIIVVLVLINILLSYRVIITDQRIGIFSYIPFGGSIFLYIWNEDIQSYFFNRIKGSFILFKKHNQLYKSDNMNIDDIDDQDDQDEVVNTSSDIYQEDTLYEHNYHQQNQQEELLKSSLETRFEIDLQKNLNQLVSEESFLIHSLDALSYFNISPRVSYINWIKKMQKLSIFQNISYLQRWSNFQKLDRWIFPNHDWIQLCFTINDSMVVSEVLGGLFTEINTLEAEEELEEGLEDRENIDSSDSDQSEYIAHQFQ